VKILAFVVVAIAAAATLAFAALAVMIWAMGKPNLTEEDVNWLKQARRDHEYEMQSLEQRFSKKGTSV
jgi:hypothetical protein